MATAAVPSLTRDDRLWDEEIVSLRAARVSMSPAVIAAVCTVLESIASEIDLNPQLALSAQTLLAEFVHEPRPAPRPHLKALRPTPA